MMLADIPADAVGCLWAEWQEQQSERIFAEARERRRAIQAAEEASPGDTPQQKQQAMIAERPLFSA